MINEILEYYFDQKMRQLLENLIDKKQFKEALSCKLDSLVFKDYVKRASENKQADDNSHVMEERIHTIERQLMTFIQRDEFNHSL